jgi:ADP-heptose:LPS heptosyltransferase
VFKCLDAIVKLIFKKRRLVDADEVTKVLIVHFGGFGDGILLLSLSNSLIELRSKYSFDLFTNPDIASAMPENSGFDNVYVIPSYFGLDYIKNLFKIKNEFKELGTYDMAVDLRSRIDNGILPLFLSHIAKNITGFKTGGFSFCLDKIAEWDELAHETEHYRRVLECAGIQVTPTIPKLIDETLDRSSSENQYITALAEPYVVVHMGSKEKYKILDTKEIYGILRTLLDWTELDIVITGLDSEAYLYQDLPIKNNRIRNLIGKLTFIEFRDTLLQATGVITVDTAAGHIAATQVPTLVFFSGVVNHVEFRPLGHHVTLALNPVQCAPCYKPCERRECMDFDTRKVTENWLKEVLLWQDCYELRD